MTNVTVYVMVMLAATLALGGMTSNAFAEEQPHILVKIAERAQNQIQNQISEDSSEDIKLLFEKGNNEVNALKESLDNDDMESAKQHFLSSMKIFSEISRQLTSQPNTETSPSQSQYENPSNDLLRMHGYVNNLKSISSNQNAEIDFSLLDELFIKARNHISNKQFKEASQTIHEIKNTILEINEELRQKSSQQQENRAQSFAEKYLKQLDRLIEHSQKIGQSEEIIQKLELAKEALTLASTPTQVINEVRNILRIQQEYDLSESKLLEQRINQIEKTATDLFDLGQIHQVNLDKIIQQIEKAKDQQSKSDFEESTESLRSIESILQEFQN